MVSWTLVPQIKHTSVMVTAAPSRSRPRSDHHNPSLHRSRVLSHRDALRVRRLATQHALNRRLQHLVTPRADAGDGRAYDNVGHDADALRGTVVGIKHADA